MIGLLLAVAGSMVLMRGGEHAARYSKGVSAHMNKVFPPEPAAQIEEDDEPVLP